MGTTNLFGVNIGAALNDAFQAASGGESMTLVKPASSGKYNPNTYGTKTTVDSSTGCFGLFTTDLSRFEGTLVEEANTIFSIFYQSLGGVEPEVNDKIQVQGKEYTILSAGLDPANAVYTIQASG